MEQQFPFGQLPQTVPPFEEPHVPFVVTAPVGESCGSPVVAVLGRESTGSAVVVAGVLDDSSVHPFWHPFAIRQ